ncbi:MAG: hypothetical protein AMXMBFR45_18300 [Gammaproteobacteria bacterium]|nr:MAG: hypothetical protein EDM71_05135 [Pseudomonadota bacterium]MBC6944594.1 hypothetical protein [Gammaproteobacteria bacterium]MCE7896219.1 hypothetical protein [Gammaproteobacteria bacterium PRO8]MDL1881071.1 hypothetical protein [Gammaproteobacteria bacterium PRO2]MCQ3934675.1 hypothetical protein [Gammaproteobacteria bacterium]
MHPALGHLLTPRWLLHRRFPPASLAAITAAIEAAERQHGGEIRFAIETCLNLADLRHPDAGRRRALELFSQLRIWDTAGNNGVLIYVLLAGHSIHIVADRGFTGRVSAGEWAAVCRLMEAKFHEGRFEAGAVAGVAAVSALIGRHFPPGAGDRNELPDAPVIIG